MGSGAVCVRTSDTARSDLETIAYYFHEILYILYSHLGQSYYIYFLLSIFSTLQQFTIV